MNVGKPIRWIRIVRGIQQRDLARDAKLSGPYLSQIETGARSPSGDVVARLAAVLSVTDDTIHLLSIDPDRLPANAEYLVRIAQRSAREEIIEAGHLS